MESYSKPKILNQIWFTPMQNNCPCIGIIKYKSDAREMKYYIGVGSGVNEEIDAAIIQQVGAKFILPDGFLE